VPFQLSAAIRIASIGEDSPHSILAPLGETSWNGSKYPPAKPEALVCEPLKAAEGPLPRPMVSEWTSVDVMLLNYDAGPDNLFWDVPIPFDPPTRLLPWHVFPISDRRKTAIPLLVLVRAVPPSTPIESSNPGYVKLLLPPRQSRGVSRSRLGHKRLLLTGESQQTSLYR
jgi:hypothetical protein